MNRNPDGKVFQVLGGGVAPKRCASSGNAILTAKERHRKSGDHVVVLHSELHEIVWKSEAA